MATPAEERTRDRVTWVVAAIVGNAEQMKRITNHARNENSSVMDTVVEQAVALVAKIEDVFPP